MVGDVERDGGLKGFVGKRMKRTREFYRTDGWGLTTASVWGSPTLGDSAKRAASQLGRTSADRRDAASLFGRANALIVPDKLRNRGLSPLHLCHPPAGMGRRVSWTTLPRYNRLMQPVTGAVLDSPSYPLQANLPSQSILFPDA
jgi:hypothetical protein